MTISFSDSWFIGELDCRRVGLSASWFVSELVCRRDGLSANLTVGELECRRVGLSASWLSASWFVGKLSSYPNNWSSSSMAARFEKTMVMNYLLKMHRLGAAAPGELLGYHQI